MNELLVIILTILVVGVIATGIYKSGIVTSDTKAGTASICYTIACILVCAVAIAIAFLIVGTEVNMLIAIYTSLSTMFIFPFIADKLGRK